jgi:hypothetical protein
MVVFDGTAFNEMFTLFRRLFFEQIIFILCITPFLVGVFFINNNLKEIRRSRRRGCEFVKKSRKAGKIKGLR